MKILWIIPFFLLQGKGLEDGSVGEGSYLHMPRLSLVTGSHPLWAQQGPQHNVVCRAGSQELEAHMGEFPALLHDLMNASLAEDKHLFECAHVQVALWQRHAYMDLNCL